MKRRSFISGILAAASAPMIVRSGVLMPVKQIISPGDTVYGFDYLTEIINGLQCAFTDPWLDYMWHTTEFNTEFSERVIAINKEFIEKTYPNLTLKGFHEEKRLS